MSARDSLSASGAWQSLFLGLSVAIGIDGSNQQGIISALPPFHPSTPSIRSSEDAEEYELPCITL